MDYHDRMTYHLEQAEHLTNQIDQWEQWAQEKVGKRYWIRNTELFLYRMESLLKQFRAYKNLVTNRDTHQKLATMYGLAAIVEQGRHGQNTPPGAGSTLARPDDH